LRPLTPLRPAHMWKWTFLIKNRSMAEPRYSKANCACDPRIGRNAFLFAHAHRIDSHL
jgi:hypothetical protein